MSERLKYLNGVNSTLVKLCKEKEWKHLRFQKRNKNRIKSWEYVLLLFHHPSLELKEKGYLVLNEAALLMRDSWRYENDIGRHYVTYLDQIIWPLTGEMMLRWDILVERIPFAIAYGIETVWQLFAADKVASSLQDSQYKVAQVVNPETKKDGGEIGQSGRCYDAMMYRQLNLMAWFLIKHGKQLCQLTVEDYQTINTHLNNARDTVILPDNDDHNPPYRVEIQSDLFIPPLAMLEAEDCLCI